MKRYKITECDDCPFSATIQIHNWKPKKYCMFKEKYSDGGINEIINIFQRNMGREWKEIDSGKEIQDYCELEEY